MPVKRFNMDKEKLIQITSDVENKSNKDLTNTLSDLEVEFNKTKELIYEA